VELVSARAINRCRTFRLFDRPNPAKPVGRRAEAVAVVVEQRVLRGQAPLALIEFSRPGRSGETAYEIIAGDWSSDVCSSDLESFEH